MTAKIDWSQHFCEARFFKDKDTGDWGYKFSTSEKKVWWYTKAMWATKQEALRAWNSQYLDNNLPKLVLDDKKNQALREKEAAAAANKTITFPIEYMPDFTSYSQIVDRYATLMGRKDLRQGHEDAAYNITMWLELTRNRMETRERVQNALEREIRFLASHTDAQEREVSLDMIAMYEEYITYTTPFDQRTQPVKKHKTKLKQQTLF